MNTKQPAPPPTPWDSLPDDCELTADEFVELEMHALARKFDRDERLIGKFSAARAALAKAGAA